ncbi:MAG TPA: 16S rRNA (cytosine(1402)-N(4))-methyltransferase RsmH [Ignavibacteriaceae bacterium]|nr:16S rRNA (cytosine(1402)-N(4))-methyltransferase RsmH [Ignavibacteriaceae bacterium]
MTEVFHKPVFLRESLDFLITDRSGTYFEGTLGFGGHSIEILKALDDKGLLISTDVDIDAFNFSKEKFSNEKRIKLYNFNFDKIDIIAKIENVKGFTGVFADLGVSSFQLDNPESGFTYREDAKLDLRMNKEIDMTAADVINTFEEQDIRQILYDFGEENNARKIVRRIVEKRQQKKISTTRELAEIILEITPKNFQTKTLSRVFQALRIYVNDELGVLKTFLTKAVDLLAHKGRIVILTYHSLEDRIVKEVFKYETLDCICPKDFPICQCDKEPRLKIITKKPLVPSAEEVKLNFRARSAKLRAAERI